MKSPLSFLFAALLLLLSCAGGARRTSEHASAAGDTVRLHHAEYLRLIEHPHYTVAQLINPWDTTRLLHTYILIGVGDTVPPRLPAGTVVRTPLRNTLVYSAVHTSLLRDLDALTAIGGVCDARYFLLPELQAAIREGRVADCGDTMNPSIERIITLNPDAILLSPFENSGGYGRVEKLDIPLIECADYMESSPLGRAEWMRFFGRLYGRAQRADSLFAGVEQRYNALKSSFADDAPERKPVVMSDLITGSTWYTPGGRSTVARLYADAGAHYIFAEDTHTGSLPYSFERIYERGRDADVWLIRYNDPAGSKTYAELESEFAGYKGFRPFAQRNVWACNTGIVPYYEEVPFHPDLLLEDFIRIFHPDHNPKGETRYYKRMAVEGEQLILTKSDGEKGVDRDIRYWVV